jgi:hypothetical protein
MDDSSIVYRLSSRTLMGDFRPRVLGAAGHAVSCWRAHRWPWPAARLPIGGIQIMGFQRSIHSIALAAGIVVVTMSLACPLGLMLAHMGLITPPLMDMSIGPVAISSQGETVYSSRQPLRTFYSVWLFVKPHTLHLLARVEIPNGGRPIRWQACSLAVRQTIVARCALRPSAHELQRG